MASGRAEEESPLDDGAIPLNIDNVHMLLQVEQEQMQKRTFTNWINAQLAKRSPPSTVSDLFSDLRDGARLLDLLEVLSGQRMKREKGRGVFQQRANVGTVLNFLKKKSVKLVNINIPDIIDGRPSIILGLIWTIILHCHIEELASTLSFSSHHSSLDSLASVDSCSGGPAPAPSPLHSRFRLSAKKALLMWVRDQCQSAGCSVSVKDFKSSWSSGEAFLAILCSLRPELVDLSLVRSRSNQQNLEEAFHLAERELHIPRLLEPKDVDVKDPDEKSIMTYVAQFLQYSKNMPAPDDYLQLFSPSQPSCLSPVNLPTRFTPAVAVSPLHQFVLKHQLGKTTRRQSKQDAEKLQRQVKLTTMEALAKTERTAEHVDQTGNLELQTQDPTQTPLQTPRRRKKGFQGLSTQKVVFHVKTQPPLMDRSEVGSKAQSMARSRLEKTRFRLQERIQQAVILFSGKEISEQQAKNKQRALRILQPAVLEEFLGAVQCYGAFCSGAQLQDLMLLSDLVRKQWEDVRSDMATFVPILRSMIRGGKQPFPTVECDMHANTLHEATDQTDPEYVQKQQACLFTEGAAPAGDRAGSLQDLCDTLAPRESFCLATDQLQSGGGQETVLEPSGIVPPQDRGCQLSGNALLRATGMQSGPQPSNNLPLHVQGCPPRSEDHLPQAKSCETSWDDPGQDEEPLLHVQDHPLKARLLHITQSRQQGQAQLQVIVRGDGVATKQEAEHSVIPQEAAPPQEQEVLGSALQLRAVEFPCQAVMLPVRSSVMWTLRNLKLLILSTANPLMLSVISHCRVIGKLNQVGAVGGHAVVGVEGVEEGAQDTGQLYAAFMCSLYRDSRLAFQSQLQKNRHRLEDPDPISITALQTHLKDLQSLKQETEALWFEFELQYSQLSRFPELMTGEGRGGVERDKVQLIQQWRDQQIHIQTSLASLDTVDLMESADAQITRITEKLDRIIRESGDISSLTLADPRTVSDLKEMDDRLQCEMRKLSGRGSEEEREGPDPTTPSSLCHVLHNSVHQLHQLRQQLEKVQSAVQALDCFLDMVREAEAKILTPPTNQETSRQQTQAVWDQERHSWQAAIQQRLWIAGEQAESVDSFIKAVGMTLTIDGATVTCWDVVASLSQRVEEVDKELTGSRRREDKEELCLPGREQIPENETCQTKTGVNSPGQDQAQEEKEHHTQSGMQLESGLESKRSRWNEQNEESQAQREEEPSQEVEHKVPKANAQRRRSQGKKKGDKEKNTSQRRFALLVVLREIQRAAEQLGLQEPTLPAVQQRMRVLTGLDSRLAGQRAELQYLRDSSSDRAEGTISGQASYMGKDNLQRLHTTVQDTKADLNGLGDGIEEVRSICRQLQTHLRHMPECTVFPFDSEANALMDRWLDVTERTDSHLDSLHLGLALWEGVLRLGGEVESWTINKLAAFAQSPFFQTEEEVSRLQDEIVAQEESMAHFHHRAAEIQALLQSTEPPLELQVVETQMRKKMEQVKELFSEVKDVYRQMVAAKEQVATRMAECYDSLQKIQDSLATLCGSDAAVVLAEIRDISVQLQTQDGQAEGLLEDLALMTCIASPESLQSLAVDGIQLQEKVRATRRLLSQVEEQTERDQQALNRERTETLRQLVSSLQSSTLQLSVVLRESGKLLERYHHLQAGSEEKQSSLTRDTEGLQALSRSAQPWVREPRQQVGAPVSLGIQNPVEHSLHNAQGVCSQLEEGVCEEERCGQLLQVCYRFSTSLQDRVSAVQAQRDDSAGRITNVPALEALLQELTDMDEDFLKLVTLKDSLVSAEAQANFSRQVSSLQHHKGALECCVREKLAQREETKTLSVQRAREEASGLQTALKDLAEQRGNLSGNDEALTDISQLKQHWNKIQNEGHSEVELDDKELQGNTGEKPFRRETSYSTSPDETMAMHSPGSPRPSEGRHNDNTTQTYREPTEATPGRSSEEADVEYPELDRGVKPVSKEQLLCVPASNDVRGELATQPTEISQCESSTSESETLKLGIDAEDARVMSKKAFTIVLDVDWPQSQPQDMKQRGSFGIRGPDAFSSQATGSSDAMHQKTQVSDNEVPNSSKSRGSVAESELTHANRTAPFTGIIQEEMTGFCHTDKQAQSSVPCTVDGAIQLIQLLTPGSTDTQQMTAAAATAQTETTAARKANQSQSNRPLNIDKLYFPNKLIQEGMEAERRASGLPSNFEERERTGGSSESAEHQPTMQDILSEIQSLVERSDIVNVLACRYQPAQLNVTAMAKQLGEAQDYRCSVLEQVATLNRRSAAGVCDPEALKSMEGRWSAALLDVSATVQVKAAQLDQVRQYHRQMTTTKALLEVLAAEKEKMSLNVLGSSALQAEKLHGLLRTMEKKKGMMEELLQLSGQLSVHLSEAESSGVLLAQLGDIQEEWRLLEGSVKRALRHAANSSSQSSLILKEAAQLQAQLKALQESDTFLQSSLTFHDSKSSLEFVCLSTDLKLYHQRYLLLQSQTDALDHFSLGRKEKEEMGRILQEVRSLLNVTKSQLDTYSPSMGGASSAKINKHLKDLFVWAKQAENHITFGKKLALFPEEARVQISEMKKVKCDMLSRQAKMQVEFEDIKAMASDMNKEETGQVLTSLKTIEDLYEAIADSSADALNIMEKNLQEREKLLRQLASIDAWLEEAHVERDPCALVENASKADLLKLKSELRAHELAAEEIKSQIALVDILAEDSKETAVGLSPAESRYLVNRLAGLWTELDGLLAHERATSWELEELIHERTSSDEELSTIQTSLEQISTKLAQQTFPLTKDTLSAIALLKHMLMEHQCQIQELKHCPGAKRSSLLCTIGELQDSCKSLSNHALEQDKYLHLRKHMDESRDIAKGQIQRAKDKTVSLGERFRLCQILLVELPFVKMQCQEAADQLEATAQDLNQSQLNSERQTIRQTVETLVSWEHAVTYIIKNLEGKLLEGLHYCSELPAMMELFQRTRLEMERAEPVDPDEKAIDTTLQRCWVIWRNLESGMRVLEALGQEEKLNPTTHGELYSLKDTTMQECHSWMESLSQARESLKDYLWAAQGAIAFLHNAEATFLSAPGGFLDCTEEQRQTQQALATLEDGLQAHICHLLDLVPQQCCLSRPKTEQLHIDILSQLLVGRATLEAQAQLRLNALQRCAKIEHSHRKCHEDVRQLLWKFEAKLSECAAERVTSYDKCVDQQSRATRLMEDLRGLAGELEELRAGCPMQGCGVGKDGELSALWRRWVSLRRGVGLLMAHSEQRGEEWKDITTSMEQCCSSLASLQAELPDSTTMSSTQGEPQELLAQAEKHQTGLEQEQQSLASLEHRLEHALSLSSPQSASSPGPVGQRLVKIQESFRSLKERNMLVVTAALAEEQEREQVQEEIEEVDQHVLALLPSLETCCNPRQQQALKRDLSSQKAKLRCIMDGVQGRYDEVPADISRRIQEVHLSLGQAEDKILESSNPVRKLTSGVVALRSGLEGVKALLAQRSPTVAEAQNTLKHVWDELDAWHSHLTLLESEAQDLAEEQPDQAHLLMDQLNQPLQLYQDVAQMSEQRTSFLSKIPACLQEFEDTLHNATCWLEEAQSWLSTPCSYTTARSLQSHANSLQLVLDDSEQTRATLGSLRPLLDEISAVCDTSAQEERLAQADHQVHTMQRNIIGPLRQLLQAAAGVDAMEAELKTIEKNVTKVRTILSSMESSNIPQVEHLHNRQVILTNLQSMQRTLEEIEGCKGELGLPEGAEDDLVAFSRATLLLQPLWELEQLTQQQATLLENKVREEEEAGERIPREDVGISTTEASDLLGDTRLYGDPQGDSFQETLFELKEQSEVGASCGGVGEESQQGQASSERQIRFAGDKEEEQRWSQLCTQISQKLTTLRKVQQEHLMSVGSGDGEMEEKVPERELETTGSATAVLQEAHESTAMLRRLRWTAATEVSSADGSHLGAEKELYVALCRVLLCLDAVTDLLLTPVGAAADDGQLRLLQQECVSAELDILGEALSSVGSEVRSTLLTEEPEALRCLTGLQDCLHTVQLVLPSSQNQIHTHLGLTHQHQDLSSNQLCVLEEFELGRPFPDLKDCPNLEYVLGRHGSESPEEKAKLQQVSRALLQGIVCLLELGEERVAARQTSQHHHHRSQLQSISCRHKTQKFFQVLRSQLAFVQHLFQQEPEALESQEDDRVQLEIRVEALQQQALEQEVATQWGLQEWSQWEDSCGELGRLLDEFEAFISGGVPEGEDDEEVQLKDRLDAYQRALARLDQSRAALGSVLDQGKMLQTGPGFSTSGSQAGGALELRWRSIHRRMEREIQRRRDIQDSWARFQADSASVREWLAGASKRLETWSGPADAADLHQECVHSRLTQLLDFSMEVQARSVQKASVSRVGTLLRRLRDTDCPGLRDQLDQLEISWSQITSDLAKTQDRLQQRLLAAWPPAELLCGLEDWVKKQEAELSRDRGTVLKANDAAQMTETLQHHQALKAGMASGQLLLDFLSQSGPAVRGADPQTLHSQRTVFAEQLGALNLRWLHLQGKLVSQMREAEQMHHTCTDRERHLRRLGSWIVQQTEKLEEWQHPVSQTLAHKALLEWEAMEDRVQEVAVALQELRATQVHVGKDEQQKHPSDIAFAGQTESISQACMAALRPTLQQTVEEWSCFERELREVSLHTTRVRCALRHQRAPLLLLKQARGCMDQLQQLQVKARRGEELWASVDKSYQSLGKSVDRGTAQLLADRMEGERTRWKELVQEMKEELLKTGEVFSLWQEYHQLSNRCSLRLQHLRCQWEALSSSPVSPQQDAQAAVHSVEKLQDVTRDLQSSMGDVLAASKPLIGRLEPLAASLIQSETRMLSHDVLLLSQALSGKKARLQEDLEQQETFCSSLEALEKQTQNTLQRLEVGVNDIDSVKMVLQELSDLLPSLADIGAMSCYVTPSNQEAERLQTLSRQWMEGLTRTSDVNRGMQAETQRSQSFQQKYESLASIQEKLERDLTGKKAESLSGLREMLATHQRLQAEIMVGHQRLHSLLRDAVKSLENETGEQRSDLMVTVARVKESWWDFVAVAGQHRAVAKEQLGWWRVYRHGLKLLWKLLRDVDSLLPSTGLAPCTLQQLQSCMDNYERVEETLGLHADTYTQTLESGRQLCACMTESQGQSQLQTELQAIEEAWQHTTTLLGRRRALVSAVVQKWSQCQGGVACSTRQLEELKTGLKHPPPVRLEEEERLIQMQENEVSLERLASGLRELATMKMDLSQYVAAGDSALLEQQLEQLHCQWEELCMKVSLRRQEIADRLNAWTIFNDKNKELCDWLTRMENKVCHSGDLSIEEMVEKLKKDCIEEINLFSENKSHLKQLGEQLLLASDQAKQTQVRGSLQEVNQRWHNLFHHIEARVKKLKETLVTVQQLDKNMSNLRSWLSRMEAELSRPITYSVCHHQEIQKRLAEQQELQRDIEQHTEGVASVLSLCDVLLRDEDAGGGTEAESDSLQETSSSLDQRWRTICAMALDRRLRIEETWRLWCKFLDDYSRFEDWLKMAERTAANPNSADVLYTVAKEELKKFEGFQRQVHERLTQLELVNNQYRRLARENRTDRASQLKATVREGNRRWDALHRRVAAILRRLKYFTGQREDFESTRESMLVWLTELDLQLTNVEHFSESDVHHKIQRLNGFQKEITLNTERIDGLIVFGEGLIQKSSPLDAALIEEELEELHSYCQEVFSRLVRFHQRLSQPPMTKEEPELLGTSASLEGSLELIGRPWLGRSQGSLPATPTHLLASPLERSGRETPVSVDSLPLEWDHTGDVGGSSTHEDEEEHEEEGTYFSALSEVEMSQSQEQFVEASEAQPASSLGRNNPFS
ncbi:nesprin-2-like [Diretmus argenteus]